jgi:hypothetical protein
VHCIACSGLQPVKLYSTTNASQFVCSAAHHRALGKTQAGYICHASEVFLDEGNFVLMKGACMQEPQQDFLKTKLRLEAWPLASPAGQVGRQYVAAMPVALTLKNVAMSSHQRLSSKSGDDSSGKLKRQRLATVSDASAMPLSVPLGEMLMAIKQQVQCCASRRHQWRFDILSATTTSNLMRCLLDLEAVTVVVAKSPPKTVAALVQEPSVPFDNQAVAQIICELMQDKNARPFLRNISRRHFPDYHKVVASPMSLTAMRKKAVTKAYRKLKDVNDDLALLRANTTQFCATRFPAMIGACASLLRAAERMLAVIDKPFLPGPSVPDMNLYTRSASHVKMAKQRGQKRKKHPMMCVCEECI